MKPDTTINLGVFQFANHEIPERVSWGGSQRIAVHELVGGQRVLDAMGRSDRALTWSGLSGRALRMPTAAHGRAADVGKHDQKGRLNRGLFGDWKGTGEGVCELRIDYGPGYRVYYGQDGNTLVILLCGGDKRKLQKDIERAHGYWKDYKARKPKSPLQGSGSPSELGRNRRVR